MNKTSLDNKHEFQGASEVSLKDTVDNAVQECIEETGIDTETERKLSVGDTSANDENAPVRSPSLCRHPLSKFRSNSVLVFLKMRL